MVSHAQQPSHLLRSQDLMMGLGAQVAKLCKIYKPEVIGGTKLGNQQLKSGRYTHLYWKEQDHQTLERPGYTIQGTLTELIRKLTQQVGINTATV